MSSRASSRARSAPTPQTELTGAASGETWFSGGDIARTIQTEEANLNHGVCARRRQCKGAYLTARKPTSVQAMAMNAATSDSPATRPDAIGMA